MRASANAAARCRQPIDIEVFMLRQVALVAAVVALGGPQGMLKKPRGLDLDPVHNAVIVSDKELNAVLTYEMPQIFKRTSSADQKH